MVESLSVRKRRQILFIVDVLDFKFVMEMTLPMETGACLLWVSV